MYRVWYLQLGVLHLVGCGKDGEQAWKFMEYYSTPPSYHPWMEYSKQGFRR